MHLPRIACMVLGAAFIVACSSSSSDGEKSEVSRLKVMSFNIWKSGHRGLEATIDAIQRSGADIIGLQECDPPTAHLIAERLGANEVHDEKNNAIVTRFPIAAIASTRDEWGGHGATVTVGGALGSVHVFNVHLFYDEYGPYYLREGKDAAFVVEREKARRMPGLEEVFAMMAPFLAENDPSPALLVGDFNAPSHLDYADLAWPESLACEARGLADSYRVVHPENRKYPGAFRFDDPGITWTPQLGEEPQAAFDRIDFVYYRKSRKLTPTSSIELDGRNSVDPWPSDHRAVLTTFAVE